MLVRLDNQIADEDKLDINKLYHKGINETDLPKLLTKDGDFLLRKGPGNTIALNLLWGGKTIKEYLFTDTQEDYQIDARQPKFPTLQDLLTHYHRTNEMLNRFERIKLLTPIYDTRPKPVKVNRRLSAPRTIARPRRLRSAYSYFVKENYSKVAEELATDLPQLIISQLGHMWRQLADEQRRKYLTKENADRDRYTQDKASWTHRHAGRPLGFLVKTRRVIDAPPKPRSAYVLYKIEMLEKLREEMQGTPLRERTQEAIRRWRALDDSTRNVYKAKAEEDRIRYVQEMLKYEKEKKAEQQRRLAEIPWAERENFAL